MFARYRTQILTFAAVAIAVAAATLVNQLAFQSTGAETDKRERGDVEVRVSARLTPNGYVEFALQRETDGVWGDRILPKSRFFPTDIGDTRWRNSSRVSLSAPAGSDVNMAASDRQAAPSSSHSSRDDDDDDRYDDDDDDRYDDDD